MVKKIKEIFNKNLFWDTDFGEIDFEKNKEFVVSRVLLQGDLSDFKKIKNLYGLKKILEIARGLRYLDKKTLNFLSLIFNIPKNKFRCSKTFSTKKQKAFWAR